LQHSLPILQPHGLKLDGKFAAEAHQIKDQITLLKADLMIVAAYGLILPRWALESTKYGCLNIHASLLPQWRGAAPIHRAVMAGDAETGICIMQMDEGLDTGDLLLCESIAIDPFETTADLHNKLSVLGANLIIKALAQIDHLTPIPQNHALASYAHKIKKEESAIDWRQSSKHLQRQILGLNPSPGSSAQLDNELYKIWHAHAIEPDLNCLAKKVPNGCIVNVSNDAIDVQCQEGLLRITQMQRAGHKKMPLSELLKGKPIHVGSCFS
jgi:methionyl-tRNA formyltransferase